LFLDCSEQLPGQSYFILQTSLPSPAQNPDGKVHLFLNVHFPFLHSLCRVQSDPAFRELSEQTLQSMFFLQVLLLLCSQTLLGKTHSSLIHGPFLHCLLFVQSSPALIALSPQNPGQLFFE